MTVGMTPTMKHPSRQIPDQDRNSLRQNNQRSMPAVSMQGRISRSDHTASPVINPRKAQASLRIHNRCILGLSASFAASKQMTTPKSLVSAYPPLAKTFEIITSP